MFDVITDFDRPPKELIEKYSRIEESASIYEVMQKNALPGSIKPIWPGTRMCGPALTVHNHGADNLMIHKAIDMLQPGDILVIACDGYNESGGLWGGMMSTSAKARKSAGLVTDGAVRDSMLIKELDYPVFSSGINIFTTSKSEKGTINHPVIIGGVSISPGDIIFGDNDAVVVIPRETAEEVYEKTAAREEKESKLAKRISSGEGTTFDLCGYDRLFDALNLRVQP